MLFLVKKGLSKKSIITAFFPTLLGLLVHFSYQEWLELTNRTTPGYNLHVNRLVKLILSGDFGYRLSDHNELKCSVSYVLTPLEKWIFI
jgi:hypothetical protein